MACRANRRNAVNRRAPVVPFAVEWSTVRSFACTRCGFRYFESCDGLPADFEKPVDIIFREDDSHACANQEVR